MNKFREHYKNLSKTHDIPIQEKLEEVETMVHEMDEKLDQYETASGAKKNVDVMFAGDIPKSLLSAQDFENDTTSKGAVETTGKKLDSIAEKAEDAETIKQKSDLVDKMKSVQLERQKAVINARKNGVGSFKDFWRTKK